MIDPAPGSRQIELPTLRMAGIRKIYGQRLVLEVDALEILPGEILGIVGPSGSGKSTLLRLLNFLEAPTAGVIEFGSYAVHSGQDAPLEVRRRVTMVFQHPLMLDRTVWENVAYGLQIRKESEVQSKVQAGLKQVGLEKLAFQRARRLSGGEAQRVALARALVLQPEVLLLDEPTANLDPANIKVIEQIIFNLNKQYHTSIVLVTHNIFQARRLAHKVAFLLDGKVVETSPTTEFFKNPSDPRTQSFVNGDMVY